MGEAMKLAARRLLHARVETAWTITAMTVGMMLILFFANAGFNVRNVVFRTFLDDFRARTLSVFPSGTEPQAEATAIDRMLTNGHVSDWRMFMDMRVLAESIDGISQPLQDMTATVLHEDHLLMAGEHLHDSPFLVPVADWTAGVLVSQRLAASLGEDPTGRSATFVIDGRELVLPIVGILKTAAEENLPEAARNSFYLSDRMLPAGSSLPARVQLMADRVQSVEAMRAEYEGAFRLEGDFQTARKLSVIDRVTQALLLLGGMVLLLLSLSGMSHALEAGAGRMRKSCGMMRLAGFPEARILSSVLAECVLVGCASLLLAALGLVLVSWGAGILAGDASNPLGLQQMVRLNGRLVLALAPVGPLAAALCGWNVWRKQRNSELHELLRDAGGDA